MLSPCFLFCKTGIYVQHFTRKIRFPSFPGAVLAYIFGLKLIKRINKMHQPPLSLSFPIKKEIFFASFPFSVSPAPLRTARWLLWNARDNNCDFPHKSFSPKYTVIPTYLTSFLGVIKLSCEINIYLKSLPGKGEENNENNQRKIVKRNGDCSN